MDRNELCPPSALEILPSGNKSTPKLKKTCFVCLDLAILSPMKRYFLLVLLFLVADARQASALVGGPFDNGSHSAELENGIYQAVMTFKNGNGFCYFHPEADIVPEDPNNLLAYQGRGTKQNRAVLYYKGISYVGSAFGMADPESRYIQCTINGGSDLGFSVSQTNTNNNNSGGVNTSGASVSDVVVRNDRGFTVNGNWEAKIRDTSPTLKFTGKGELVFIAPTGADSIAGLAYQGYSGLIGAIITAVGGLNGSFNPAIFTQAQLAMDNALTALPAYLAGAGIDSTLDNGDTVKIKVRGTFRYL